MISISSKFSILLLLNTLSVFIYSIFIYPYYSSGDQAVYRTLFEGLSGLGFLDSFSYQALVARCFEPVSAVIFWFSSQLTIPKDFIFSFYNVFLADLLFCLFYRFKVLPYYPFVICGFYFQVLFFAAERLKFASIFVLASFLFPKFPSGIIYKLLAVLSHFQLIIFPLFSYFPSVYKYFALFAKGKLTIKSIYIFLLSFFALSALFPFVLPKLIWYISRTTGFSELVQLFVLLAIAFVVFGFRNYPAWAILSLSPFIYLLGSGRLNIFAYFLFLSYTLIYRRLSHPLSISLMLYYIYKSYGFLGNIIQNGDGFSIVA